MEFAPRKSKSKEFCCVFGCSCTVKKSQTVRFFRFPKAGASIVTVKNIYGISENIDRCKAWEKALRMGKNATNTMVVCSLHFTSDSFYCSSLSSKKKVLLNSAIPSVNLPASTIDTKKTSARKKLEIDERSTRAKNRQHKPCSALTIYPTFPHI